MGVLDELQERFGTLIDAYERGGPLALTTDQRRELGLLFVREARKGAIPIDGRSDAQLASTFIEHARREFVGDSELKVAVDYQKQLLTNARSLRDEPHPIAAVILYATWADHWINGAIVTSALRNGFSAGAAAKKVSAKLPARLGPIWESLGLAPLPGDHRRALITLARVRNQYVHYKWVGRSPEVLAGPDKVLRDSMADFETTVFELNKYERTELSGPAIRVADGLFEVDLESYLSALYD